MARDPVGLRPLGSRSLLSMIDQPPEVELWPDLSGPVIPEELGDPETAPVDAEELEKVKLWLDPVARLAPASSRAGPAVLHVESRAGRDASPCSLRIVEGRGMGRTAQVDGGADAARTPRRERLVELERSGRRVRRYTRIPSPRALFVDWGRRVSIRVRVSDSRGGPDSGSDAPHGRARVPKRCRGQDRRWRCRLWNGPGFGGCRSIARFAVRGPRGARRARPSLRFG